MNRALSCIVLAAPLAAQQPEPLELVAQTQALGGEIQRCVFDSKGERMLTIGDRSDLVYWDLNAAKAVSRHELPTEFVTALALHPTEPWAYVAITTGDFEGGSQHVLDLDSGQWRELGRRYVQAAAFDPAGDRLGVVVRGTAAVDVEVFAATALDEPIMTRQVAGWAWQHTFFTADAAEIVITDLRHANSSKGHVRIPLDGGPLQTGEAAVVAFAADGQPIPYGGRRDKWSAASDGSGIAWTSNKRVFHRPAGATADIEWDMRPYMDAWLQRLWVAPRGLVLVADVQDQLHLLGPEPGRRRLVAAHCGGVAGLTWSPDGKYLAIQSMGALRIVDRSGAVVVERVGTHGVVAGDSGSEFTLVDREGISRWNVAVGRQIGDTVKFQGGAPELLGNRPRPGALGLGGTLYAAMAITRARDGWITGLGRIDGRVSFVLHVAPDGRVSPVATGRIAGAYHGMQVGETISTADGSTALFSWFTQSGGSGTGMIGCTVFGAVRSIDPAGRQLGQTGFPAGVWWLRRVPGAAGLVAGLGNGQIVELDAATLNHDEWMTAPSPLRWFEFVSDDHAIGGDGKNVWWIDRRSHAQQLAALPDGMADVLLSAITPDRRHLALAGGREVWILRLR